MKRIPFVTGHYYHLYNRGRSKLPIFHSAADYRVVLAKMKEVSLKYEIVLVAYCLLPNHYHLMVRQDGEPRAGLLPQRVFNSYGKWYNKKYGHSGTIFQGPFKSKLVPDEPYLWRLCNYIHANPVLHGLVRDPADWVYSNYREWIGVRNGSLIDRELVKGQYPEAALYEATLFDYLKQAKIEEDWDF